MTLLDPRPLVKDYGWAIAHTPTQLLHELVRHGEYRIKWDENWQVHRVTADEWGGEQLK